MKKALLAMSLFFFILPAAARASETQAAAPVYGLDELFGLALERAEKIKLSEEELRIAEAGRDRARSLLMPKLSIFGDARRYSEEKTSASGSTLQPGMTSSWGARLDHALSLGGRELTGLKTAKQNAEKRGYDFEGMKEGYLFTVAAAYYDVLKARKSVEIAAANTKRLKRHRDAAEARLRVGEVTKTALLRAEAELSGAEAQAVSSGNRLGILKAQLARIVWIEGEFELKDAPLAEASGIRLWLNLASLKEEAFGRRPEMKSAELGKRIAEGQARYAKAAYRPTVSVEGVYSRRDDDPASQFLVKESIYGGIKLTFPVFDGGLRAADVAEAHSRLRQAELGFEDIRKTVTLEVEEAYLNLMTQAAVLKSFEDQLAFARDNYDAVSRQFEFGLATSTDVMDANTLLVIAESQLADAAFNRRLAELRLDRATGNLLKKSSSGR
ncbi:MAG: TolC family protein [Parvibaculum sp.]|uniref:TolC family protein n=1 Tax=Parvibaculum sp. TaxID=2024848 RepID=UPI00272EFA0D|nr:TolC family protein [Parvibaculum sp.]MDP2151616.1 TolC family protein [Parvibaculum sp.]